MITLINLTGWKPGVQAAETGINIKSFKTLVEPEFRTPGHAIDGTVCGWGVAPMKKEVTMDGEVTGSTGAMAASATVAFTPANSSSYFGAPTTGLYLTKGEVTESRESGEWVSVSVTFEANAGVA